jgi:RNA polymerase sigma-B factor
MTSSDSLERFEEYRRTRNRSLRDELVAEHAGLAHAQAKRYSGRGEAMDDLRQVAMLGLFKAVERFEPDRGFAFSTFAVPTIVGELKRHFRDHGWAVRVPRSLQELALRVNATVAELSHTLGHSPSVDDVARALDVSVEEVLEAMEASRSFSADSLDAPHGEDGSPRFERALGVTDPELEHVEQRMLVEAALEVLPAREQEIVRLRFEEGLSQTEIAARVGISQMHVSRLLSSSLRLMREHLSAS